MKKFLSVDFFGQHMYYVKQGIPVEDTEFSPEEGSPL